MVTEWRNVEKTNVTLWNIMTHTSGLYHEQSSRHLCQQEDVVKYALNLPIVTPPGRDFSYSNEAVALLPRIVLAASGKPLDVFLKEKLFEPMGIKEVKWDRDPAGNVMVKNDIHVTAPSVS